MARRAKAFIQCPTKTEMDTSASRTSKLSSGVAKRINRVTLAFILAVLGVLTFTHRHELIYATLHPGDVWAHNRSVWASGQELSKSLRDARSVVLSETAEQIIISRRPATVEEIARLQRALSGWPLSLIPEGGLCFEPHHHIEIIRADGSSLEARVCFLCHNFKLGDAGEERSTLGLPELWNKSLDRFFTSVGMTPKSSQEYASIANTGPQEQ